MISPSYHTGTFGGARNKYQSLSFFDHRLFRRVWCIHTFQMYKHSNHSK